MTLQRNSIICSLVSVALRELASFSSLTRSRTPGDSSNRLPLRRHSYRQQLHTWRYASDPDNPLATPWANFSCREFLREATRTKMA